jgi:hypothetical protein
MEDLVQAVQGMQNQLQQQQAENQQLRDRITNFELQQAASCTASGGLAVSPWRRSQPDEILRAPQGLPEAISRMNRPKGLIDPKGLGKPTVLGDDADAKFRLWAIKLEDDVAGVFGGRGREVLEWSAGMDAEVTQTDIDNNFGMAADLNDQWDEVDELNSQLYTQCSERRQREIPLTWWRIAPRGVGWKLGASCTGASILPQGRGRG